MDCQDLMMHFIKVVIHQSNGLDQFVYHQVYNLYLGGRKLIDKEELKLFLEMRSESERIDSIMVSRGADALIFSFSCRHIIKSCSLIVN